ncbi:SDR family NAD(P)-dependent oxidoreductase [Phenylobacterium sp.]|jgi:NAD(P)-dependent dehydrogenase (short-subunit alcohol dehydrogenase family)|uniref:SDR family NAD(P)-dependent oxidoreductase n=1 Tax=Phenylobacterium sp. TaxID=1871053 RepID=UPI002F40EFC7
MSDRITSPFGAHTPAREVAAGHDLTYKSVIVTGASSGIGVETARAFAEIGAVVTLGVRDLEAGEAAAESINQTASGPQVVVAKLDLADLDSVRAFAAEWGSKPLHILVNNAGVMACDQAYTAQGLEMQIGTNHFGHSLLTLLLAANLEKAAKPGRTARVVQLTSGGHRRSAMRWDDVHFRSTPYDPWLAYGQSKTANSLFAVEFSKRFAGRGVTANAVHPGGIRTRLQRHVTPEERKRQGWPPENQPAPNLKTAEQGASTSIWAALGPELEGIGGLYLEDCAQALPAKEGTYGGVSPWALDPAEAERLWTLTRETVGEG